MLTNVDVLIASKITADTFCHLGNPCLAMTKLKLWVYELTKLRILVSARKNSWNLLLALLEQWTHLWITSTKADDFENLNNPGWLR